MIRRRQALLFALLALSSAAHASGSKAGTSGAQFLKIGAGARPTAMGEAFVGVADDVNAVYHNPAGLAFLDKREFTAMHTQYFQGLDYNFGAFVQPTNAGTFGISAVTLQTDEITRFQADESANGSFSNQDSAYALSYGRTLGNNFGLGATARWIREQIDNTSANAWTGDIGLFKKFENAPYTLGFAVRHFGSKIRFQEESDSLPLTFDAGAGLRLWRNQLLFAADIRSIKDSGTVFGAGIELQQSILGKIRYAGRVGYNSANTDPGGATGTSLGAGLGYQGFEFDFAWVPFGDLGNTFRYAATFKF